MRVSSLETIFRALNEARAEYLVVDIFVAEPFDFTSEYRDAKLQEFAPDLFVPIVSLSRLIAMKTEVGRPQDLIDVEKLSILKSIADENA